jgi:hypothetical protein
MELGLEPKFHAIYNHSYVKLTTIKPHEASRKCQDGGSLGFAASEGVR